MLTHIIIIIGGGLDTDIIIVIKSWPAGKSSQSSTCLTADSLHPLEHMVLGENNRSYETSSHNLPCSNEPFTLTYMHQTPYDVAILVEAWLEPGMDIRRLSHTVSSPTLTDPDMILPDQTSWPLPLSISKPSYSVRSRSPVSKDGQSALPGVTRISVLGPKTPSLSSTKGIEIKPKQATPYGEDTLAFPGTLRAKTQHKTSTDPESALESGLSDGDISIRSENLDEIKWPGLDSDSVDGASVFSEEDTVHEGDNVSGAIVADQDKLAQFKRGSKRDEELDLHTAMSQKAELILANAKKKLNVRNIFGFKLHVPDNCCLAHGG